MLAAIILAAGDSTRMGRPKALLSDPDGRPFVARLVRAFGAAGIETIVVVTGAAHEAIVAALSADAPPVRAVHARNPEPSRGQLSSLLTGLDAVLGPDVEGVLVTPVDIPMIRPQTIRAVADAWTESRAPIVRPVVGGDRHGHPVLFDRAVFDALRRAPLAEGARAVVRAHATGLQNVDVDDEGCLLDVDTPAEYRALIRQSLED